MDVNFKKINKNATIPERGSEFAGGWDVTATEIEQVSEDFVICKIGFALGLPSGTKLTLVPRSSLTKTHWVVQNSPGLGDEDYRGEYQFRFRCIPSGIEYVESNVFKLKYDEFPFKLGERIGQVYLEEVIPMNFIEVEELPETKRSTGGFGSTGN